MERVKLDVTHVKLQFLMMFLSLLAFLGLAAYVGNIVWFADFRNFIVLISGIFAIFIGVIAMLRYYTNKGQMEFLFLGVGFLGVGLLDLLQILFVSNGFNFLFTSTTQVYTLNTILSKGFLSLLIFLSWFVLNRNNIIQKEEEIRRKEKAVMFSVSTICLFFTGILISLVLYDVIQESLLVVLVGIGSLLLLILALVGYIFRRGWWYENFDFWMIFMISFLIVSQLFYLPFLNLEYFNMTNLSVWAQFIGYIALLTGFMNSIYELYQREKEIQKELAVKNKLLGEAKVKIEEAYLITRKEKWELANQKVVKKAKPVPKKKVSKRK